VTVSTHVYAAYLIGTPDIELSVRGGSVAMDAGSAPHVTADLEVAMPADPDTLDLLDPRLTPRVRIDVTATFPALTQTRSFNLGVRDRDVSQQDGTVQLALASDEALLADYAPLTDDGAPFALASSLRAVVDYVLDAAIPGASLEPGPDLNVSPYWTVTNLSNNSGVRNVITGYSAGTGSSGVVRSTSVTLSGLPSAQFTASGTGEAYLNTATKDVRVTPGRKYVYHFRMISSGTARPVRAMIRWKDSAGNNVGVTYSTAVTGSTSSWPVFSLVGVIAPPNATTAETFVNTVTNAAGQNHFATAFMFYEGDRIIDWFDGASTIAGYTVAWDDPAQVNASTSTR
jgi:hypothetical protein